MESGSERLAAAIAAIRKFAENKSVGKGARPELLEMAERLEPDQQRLAEIEDMFAIDFGTDIDSKISGAAALWTSVEPGAVRGDQLLALRKASPLLSELFLKGIDFQRAHKFSPIEFELAEWFGTRIDKVSEFLHALRREKPSEREQGAWVIFASLSLALRDALKFLVDKKLWVGKTLRMKTDTGWAPFRHEWFRDDPKTLLMIVYEKKNAQLLHFLHGHWLNAYVYAIIDNQLARHEIPYELYTEVVYKAQPDLIRAASDFDVIGRFRDTVICVECKSGRLDDKHGQLDEIVKRTEDLRTVFSSMGTGETKFMFFVVYDPEMNAGKAVEVKLKEHDIRALRPNEVRSVIASTLGAALK